MGGIFGVICREKIPKGCIYEGLRRLIYRGYDGAGVVFYQDNSMVIRKSPGNLLNISDKLDLVNIDSSLAIGHTRYASRGWPVYENTHPLLDCTGNIAVVGDGIIENYEEIKSNLERKGHVFKSRTDTEVSAHLFEDFISKGMDDLNALLNVSRELTGNYALVLVRFPHKKIYFIQRGQPLVIAYNQGRDCIYIASDLPSLYGFAEMAYIIEDNTVGFVSLDELRVFDIQTSMEIDISKLQVKRVKYLVEFVEKGGYPHYMIKEIYEIPEAMNRTTIAIMEKYLRLASMIIRGAKNVMVIGSGTSFHAALTSTYYLAELAGIEVIPVSSAEFPYSMLENVETGTVIIAISQSGETSDVITSVKMAKQRGAVIIGVTNNVGSRLALESNVYLPVGAGLELAVPATKTFVSTLVTLLLLASYTGIYTGKRSLSEHKSLIDEIRGLSRALSMQIPLYEKKAIEVAKSLRDKHSMYIASSGITYPIALEASLKFKEASLVHAEGFQLGELRHGPLSIISREFPVILIEPFEETAQQLYLKVLQELENKGAYIVSLECKYKSKFTTIELVESSRYTYPISAIVPLQLIAYHLGALKGLPVDTPPGLAKTLTT